MSQAPAGNWIQVISSEDWKTVADTFDSLAWYRKTFPSIQYASAVITTVVFG